MCAFAMREVKSGNWLVQLINFFFLKTGENQSMEDCQSVETAHNPL